MTTNDNEQQRVTASGTTNEKHSTLFKPFENVTIFEDEIINNKTLEHASLIITETWAFANKISETKIWVH